MKIHKLIVILRDCIIAILEFPMNHPRKSSCKYALRAKSYEKDSSRSIVSITRSR